MEKKTQPRKLIFRSSTFTMLMLTFIIVFFLIPSCEEKIDGGGRKVVIWTNNPMAGDLHYFRETEKDIEKKFNIILEYKFNWMNEFFPKLETAMVEGIEQIDIINIWYDYLNLRADPTRCYALPLEDFVKKSKIMQGFPAGKLSWYTLGGHLYGLPIRMDPFILVYNDTLWQEAGVDLSTITTWDEFFVAAQKLASKKENGRSLHYALAYREDSGFWDSTSYAIWQQTGAHMSAPAGNPLFTESKFKDFMKKWMAWRGTGVFCTWKYNTAPRENLLKNGTLASFIGASAAGSLLYEAERDGKYKFRVRALPLYEGGNGSRTATFLSEFYALSRTVKDPELVYKILEYTICGDVERAKSIFQPHDGIRYDWGLMAVPAAWEDPSFHQPEQRFGGQKLGELLIECAKDIPAVVMSDWFLDGLQDFNEVYKKMAAGKISIDEGLQKTQDAVLQRMK
jgi:ABC-type glycerol-3-phosphate transport system substrate-binding protein